MSHEFSNIILTKDEFKILKRLNKQNMCIEDSNAFTTLVYHDFIEQIANNVDENNNLIFGETCKISEYGKRYLTYLKKGHKKIFWEWFRYIFTTIIAILALCKSYNIF